MSWWNKQRDDNEVFLGFCAVVAFVAMLVGMLAVPFLIVAALIKYLAQ